MVITKTQKPLTARTNSMYRHKIGNVDWNQVVVNIDYYKTLSVVLYLLGAFENNLYLSSHNGNSTQMRYMVYLGATIWVIVKRERVK